LTYLLIIFVIALALAPLTHFIPSKRQRQVARMREYAATHGLFVEFRNPPGPLAVPPVGEDAPRGDLIYYGSRLPPRRKRPVERGSWLREDQGWRGLDRRRDVPEPLLELPPAVLGASVDEGSCGVYWRESREEEDVHRIQQVLERWSALLCS
jgi:hypothetical protein